MTRIAGGLVATVGVIVLILCGGKLTGALAYNDDMLAAGTKIAGALFVSAVLLERSLAVLNSLWFADEVRNARTNLLNGDQAALHALDAVRAREAELRLAIGFIVAMCISAAGIRTLEALVQSVPAAGPNATFFFTIDVLVTAGLLAGGSNALAEVIVIFKARTQLAYAETMRRLGAQSLALNSQRAPNPD